MHVLIGIALKSLLIAGLTLGLLQLMKNRSAAERSWVAHIGLLALRVCGLLLQLHRLDLAAAKRHLFGVRAGHRDGCGLRIQQVWESGDRFFTD